MRLRSPWVLRSVGSVDRGNRRGGHCVKAVRVHEYHSDPRIDDIPEPTLQGPLDVIVKVGGAGVCRTDLHIVNGDWAAGDEPRPALRHRARERRLGARDRRGRHERRRRRHGDPAPAAVVRAVPGLPGRQRHALRQRLLPRPEQQRRRDGRVPAHHGPGLRQARPLHQPGGRRRAGRRRHHGVPRGAQGRAAPVARARPPSSRARAGWATSASRRSRRCARRGSSWSTRTPTRSRWPRRSARTRRWSPTAATSTPSRT